jgi:hypothetical protein
MLLCQFPRMLTRFTFNQNQTEQNKYFYENQHIKIHQSTYGKYQTKYLFFTLLNYWTKQTLICDARNHFFYLKY